MFLRIFIFGFFPKVLNFNVSMVSSNSKHTNLPPKYNPKTVDATEKAVALALRQHQEALEKKRKELEEKENSRNKKIVNLRTFPNLSKHYKTVFELCETDLKNIIIGMCPYNRTFSEHGMKELDKKFDHLVRLFILFVIVFFPNQFMLSSFFLGRKITFDLSSASNFFLNLIVLNHPP